MGVVAPCSPEEITVAGVGPLELGFEQQEAGPPVDPWLVDYAQGVVNCCLDRLASDDGTCPAKRNRCRGTSKNFTGAIVQY
jgi:hypothetical protein